MVSPRSSDVQGWLAHLYEPEDIPDDEANAAALRWLRRYYDDEGPSPREIVWAAMLAYKVALAEDVTAAVLRDLHRTSTLRPEVAVDAYDGAAVRIWIDRGYAAPSMWALDRPEALAEVAAYFQEQLDVAEYLQNLEQSPGLWPVCDEHACGLHPEVHDRVAVWWCHRGDHAVAPIGALGS